jgi:outer membrane protein
MKKVNVIAVWVMILGLAAFVVWSQNKNSKIAYIDTSVVMDQFNEGVAAKEKLNIERKKWQSTMTMWQDSIKAVVANLEANSEKMKAKTRNAEIEKLKEVQDRFARYRYFVTQEEKKKESELLNPVISKIDIFLKDWGKKNNYALVFGTMQGGNIVYADEAYNATVDVVKGLNELYRRLPQAGVESKKEAKVQIKLDTKVQPKQK